MCTLWVIKITANPLALALATTFEIHLQTCFKPKAAVGSSNYKNLGTKVNRDAGDRQTLFFTRHGANSLRKVEHVDAISDMPEVPIL